MPTKKTKRSTKSVKSLKTRGLTAKQAKNVKGGIIIINSRLGDPPGGTSPRLVDPPDPDFGIKR
jgi:hypothetical protein